MSSRAQQQVLCRIIHVEWDQSGLYYLFSELKREPQRVAFVTQGLTYSGANSFKLRKPSVREFRFVFIFVFNCWDLTEMRPSNVVEMTQSHCYVGQREGEEVFLSKVAFPKRKALQQHCDRYFPRRSFPRRNFSLLILPARSFSSSSFYPLGISPASFFPARPFPLLLFPRR